MAINEKNTKPTISAAPSGIKTDVKAAVAQNGVALKAPTDSRLKSEQDVAFQAMMAGMKKPSEEDIAFQRFIQLALLENKHDLNSSSNEFQLLTYNDIKNKRELSQAEIFAVDPSDKQATQESVVEHVHADGKRSYYTGAALTEFLASRPPLKTSANGVAPTTSNSPDRFRLTSIGDIQREMHAAIELASRETGVPAKLLGAMAGKESIFGKQQTSFSGAEGLFHQTDGYLIANYVITNNDIKKNPARVKEITDQINKIASVVPEVAEYMQDGKITLAEARKLAWNPAAAAMLTALRAQDVAKDFGLNLNNPSSWAYVYTDHNAGRGSLNALAKGGMTEKWIQDLNQSMYRGANSAKDVLQIAANDMERWGNRYESIVEKMNQSSSSTLAMAAIAKASASSKATLRNPAPEPS